MSSSNIPQEPIITDNSTLISAITDTVNNNVNAKVTEVKSQLTSDTNEIDEALADVTVGDDLNANTANVNNHVSNKADEVKAHIDAATDFEKFKYRYYSDRGNTAGVLRIKTATSTSYTSLSVEFNNYIASYFGSTVLVTSEQVGQWVDLCNLTGRRGSFHGFITPRFNVGQAFSVRVTIDDVIFIDKTITMVSSDRFLHTCALKSHYGSYDYEKILQPAKLAHIEGKGEKFNNSLRVEIRANDGIDTASQERQKGSALYYSEVAS